MVILGFPGEPKAVQSFRFTRNGHKYQPNEITDWKTYIRLMAIQKLPKGFKPFSGAVEIVRAVFVFAPPKSWPKSKKRALEEGATIYKITKPDLTDNLFKGLIDALSGTVWERDQQICKKGDCVKIYGVDPRTVIMVREIPEIEFPKKLSFEALK